MARDLSHLPDEILLMILDLVNSRGGNIIALRPVCRRVRNLVQYLMRKREETLDRNLATAVKWQALLSHKLMIFGPVCFWIATNRRCPFAVGSVFTAYLGGPEDKIPHPFELGKLAPTFNEMERDETDPDDRSRFCRVGDIVLYRFNVPVAASNVLKMFSPSIYSFGFTTPSKMLFIPWKKEIPKKNRTSTIYFDVDSDLADPINVRLRQCGFKIKIVDK